MKRMESAILASQLSTLYWVTDSHVLTIWLKKGSKVLAIQNKVSELFCLLHKLKLRIITIWKPQSGKIDGIHLKQEFAQPFHLYPDIVTCPEHSTSSFQHGVMKKMIAVWFNSTIGDGQYSPLSQRCLIRGCGVCIN